LESLCGRSSITEIEAKEDAKKRLQVYCEREGIDIAEFSEPEISKQEDVPWIIDYTSKKNHIEPYHVFRVTIDNCGRIEKSHKKYDFRNANSNSPNTLNR
jgi:hypothetical protein